MSSLSPFNIMEIKPQNQRLLHPAIISVFVICFAVWFYLFYVTQPVVVYDSISYESTGKMIYEQGWIAFLKAGLYREYGYAFLVSIAMRLADYLHVSYLTVVKFIQLLFLFSAQLLSYYVMRRLRIHPLITAWALLYIGLSPGLLFSTMILYYEAGMYPFVLLLLIGAAHAWLALIKENKNIVIPTIVLAVALFCCASIKAIFEPLSYFMLLPFLALILKAIIAKRKAVYKKGIVFLIVFAIFFYLPITAYKLVNKYYNNEYTLTDRSGRIFLGSTLVRVQDFEIKQLKSLIVFTFMLNHCATFADPNECGLWDWRYGDKLALSYMEEYAHKHNLPLPLTQRQLTNAAFQEILNQPLRYALVTIIHSFKIFYWEYFFGFAAYPDWMDRTFLVGRLGLTISLTSAFLAFLGFSHLCWWVWHNRRRLVDNSAPMEMRTVMVYILFLILVGFGILSSLLWILDRYILPVASLYIISIAFFLDQTLIRRPKTT
ncbi:MAG TPA: hypothetical protein VI749_07360 [Candidatus Omnitrophota bacterium]|nr:hypothetical protein [Candidatus Omnitrophota bacterium]